MKLTLSQLKSVIRKALNEVKELICPPATKDVDLNTENRNAAREDHSYGPMNPLESSDGYWDSLSSKWEGATSEEAMGMRCGNCIAFDISPRMRECMPIAEDQYLPDSMKDEESDPMDLVDTTMINKAAEDFPGMPEGAYVGFGYCWMHHFKCHSARSCDTWAGEGPMEEDEDSEAWQNKNPFSD